MAFVLTLFVPHLSSGRLCFVTVAFTEYLYIHFFLSSSVRSVSDEVLFCVVISGKPLSRALGRLSIINCGLSCVSQSFF